MLGLMVVDAMVMPRLLTPDSWPTFLRLTNFTWMLHKLIRREPLINITAHYGNWELLGYAMAVIGYPVSAVARPLDNPFINKWLLGVRESRGMRIITKWGATTIVQDILRSGGRVGFTADQNAGDQGLFVPFFGRLASSYKSIGLLALQHHLPIVVGCAVRLPGNHFLYELQCSDIQPGDGDDDPQPSGAVFVDASPLAQPAAA
jgi:Kdo2-lipid IVA lauroyltransferase/acyltransferase